MFNAIYRTINVQYCRVGYADMLHQQQNFCQVPCGLHGLDGLPHGEFRHIQAARAAQRGA